MRFSVCKGTIHGYSALLWPTKIDNFRIRNRNFEEISVTFLRLSHLVSSPSPDPSQSQRFIFILFLHLSMLADMFPLCLLKKTRKTEELWKFSHLIHNTLSPLLFSCCHDFRHFLESSRGNGCYTLWNIKLFLMFPANFSTVILSSQHPSSWFIQIQSLTPCDGWVKNILYRTDDSLGLVKRRDHSTTTK